MAKWDYLVEADATLRKLYKRWASTQDETDERRFKSYFDKLMAAKAKEELFALLPKLDNHPLVRGDHGWAKGGARYDAHDVSHPYTFRGHKDPSMRVWYNRSYVYGSMPVKIASSLSQFEIIDIVFYYEHDGDEYYKIFPNWVHSSTSSVEDRIIIPTIRKLYPRKKHSYPPGTALNPRRS